jgi:hypothetical protein
MRLIKSFQKKKGKKFNRIQKFNKLNLLHLSPHWNAGLAFVSNNQIVLFIKLKLQIKNLVKEIIN